MQQEGAIAIENKSEKIQENEEKQIKVQSLLQ